MSIEQWSDLMFPEREGTVTPIYGSVRAINDDGSYEVQLNASSVTTRCTPCCTATVGDRVLVLIKANGKCDAIGRLGGDAASAVLNDTMGSAWPLETTVTPGANYSSVSSNGTYLIGNCLRVAFTATRSSATSGNITNETVCTIKIKHEGRIKGGLNVSFTNGSSGGNASFTTSNMSEDEGYLTFDVFLTAIAQSSTTTNAYFIIPVSLNIDLAASGSTGGSPSVEVSDEQIKAAVDAYLDENPVSAGATAEQVEQIEQNAEDIATLSQDKLDASAVSEWALQPTKPTYTATEIGADSKGSADAALASAKAYADQQIAAIPTPDVSGQINAHNVATDAHNDIRLLVEDLTARLTALADSDDDTLDQLSEVVAYIKANRELIESVTTAKVNVSDIIDNLTTNVSDRPLSAAQGVVLKGLIDAITVPTKVSELENDAGYLTNATVGVLYKAAWTCSEASGISQRYTDSLVLPPGTYIISVIAPYTSDFTARVCISFSAKLAIGSGATFIDAAYGAFTTVATFTSETTLYVLSAASSNAASWSYLDRGGLAAVRIA